MNGQHGHTTSRTRNAVLIVTTIASFLIAFTLSAANVALPEIAFEFGLDPVELGWVQASYLLASVVILVPAGRIADIKGRKKVFLAGLLTFALSSLTFLFPISKAIMFVARISQGAGGAMIVGTAVAMLTSVFPLKERGKVLGVNTGAVYVGISMGPFLGGVLTQNFGWRSVFLLNVPLAMLAFFLTVLVVRQEWADAIGSRFDLLGSITYGTSLALVVYGISLISSSFSTNASLFEVAYGAIAPLSLGVIFMLSFVFLESKSESPVLDVRLFRSNIVFAFCSFAALINYSATYAITFLLSLYLQLVKGLGPQMTGLLLVSNPIVQATLSPFAGSLSDKMSPRILSTVGMAVTALGLVLFAFLDYESSVMFIALNLAFIGLGFSLFSSPNTNALMGSVDRKSFGVASSILATMRQLGMIMSTFIAAAIITLYIGPIEISDAPSSSLMSGISWSFVVSSTLCFIGVIFSFAGVRKDRPIRG